MQRPPLVDSFQNARKEPLLAVLEGFHAIKHALRFGAQIERCVTNDLPHVSELAGSLAPDLSHAFREMVEVVDDGVFQRLAPRAPRTGLLAIARRPPYPPDVAFKRPFSSPVVLLEDPRNLNNVGACIRIAAAAGVKAVLTTGSNDPWHPDAIRGSAGLHFALPVLRLETSLPETERKLVAVDPEGEPFNPDRLTPDTILAFGTEREGLTEQLLDQAQARVALPMEPGVSSINLAAAVAAVLFSYRLAAVG